MLYQIQQCGICNPITELFWLYSTEVHWSILNREWMGLLPRYDSVTSHNGHLEKFIKHYKAVKLVVEIDTFQDSNFHSRAQILSFAIDIISSP